jgi:hypothetical protein
MSDTDLPNVAPETAEVRFDHAISPTTGKIAGHAARVTVGNLSARFILVGFTDGKFTGDKVDLTENLMRLEDACVALKSRIFSLTHKTLRRLHEQTNQPEDTQGEARASRAD